MLLNNALMQTGWSGGTLDESTWRKAIHKRLQGVNWENAIRDVHLFLEQGADDRLLRREQFDRLLSV
jgi:hypothetical protein